MSHELKAVVNVYYIYYASPLLSHFSHVVHCIANFIFQQKRKDREKNPKIQHISSSNRASQLPHTKVDKRRKGKQPPPDTIFPLYTLWVSHLIQQKRIV